MPTTPLHLSYQLAWENSHLLALKKHICNLQSIMLVDLPPQMERIQNVSLTPAVE